MLSENKTGKAKLTCRNWESGVVIPIPLDQVDASRISVNASGGSTGEQDLNELALDNLSLKEVFSNVVPVPMVFPAEKMIDLSKSPWLFMG